MKEAFNIKKFLFFIPCFLLTGCIFFVLINAPLSFEMKMRTVYFNLFMFTLFLPSVFFVTRVMFGNFSSYWLSILFIFMAFAIPTSRGEIYFPKESLILGLDAKWFLLGIIILSFTLACLIYKFKHSNFFPNFFQTEPKRKVVFLSIILIFIMCFAQNIFRFGQYCLPGEEKIPTEDRLVKNNGQNRFFGIGYVGWDMHHHTSPGALFSGTNLDPKIKRSVINDRPNSGYIYALFSRYFHPYIAQHLGTLLFYFFSVSATYLLARHVGLSNPIGLSLAIIFLSCDFMLLYSSKPYGYIYYYGAVPIIIYFQTKIKLLSGKCAYTDIILFICLLSLISLAYYPYIYVLYSLIMLLCYAAYRVAVDNQSLKKVFNKKYIILILLAVFIPLIVKISWAELLSAYDMLGREANRDVNAYYLSNLLKLPQYFFEHPIEFAKVLNSNFITVAAVNYIEIERWQIVGFTGLQFLLFLPKYLPANVYIPLYSIYIATIVVSLIASLSATIWPHSKFPVNLALTPARSCLAQLTLSFAQLFGFYHMFNFAKCFLERLFKTTFKFRLDYIILTISCIIFLLSFSKLYAVWSVWHDKYPLFPIPNARWSYH